MASNIDFWRDRAVMLPRDTCEPWIAWAGLRCFWFVAHLLGRSRA